MVHTELRSKASIGYTSQSCGGTPTRKVLPELPLPNSGPGMRALSPTVALPARSVEPDWSLERAHGEAHDVKQSPHPKNQLGCERMRPAGARTLRDTAAANPSTPTWRKSTETRCTLPSTHRAGGDVTSCGGSRGHRSASVGSGTADRVRQTTPRRHAARTALPTKRATSRREPADGARCVCRLAIDSPDLT
jgi:hypothetical protein